MKILFLTLSSLLSIFSHTTSHAELFPGDCEFRGDLEGADIRLDQCGKDEKRGLVDSMMANRMANILCTGARCSASEMDAVKNLASQLNPGIYNNTSQVGDSNRGLRNFFQDQSRDHACFGELAFRFYQNSAFSHNVGNDLTVSSQKGKAWDVALRMAGGNADLAVELIGTCGHDDEGSFMEKHLEVCSDKSHLLSVVHDLGGKCQEGNPPEAFNAIKYSCPSRGSSYFMPEGLPGTAVSSTIKNELAQDYYPGVALEQALQKIPHKSYHIYGSAYLTCHMIEGGVPREKALAIERETAIIYRAIRVCSTAQKNTDNFNDLLDQIKQPEIDFSSNPADVLSQWNASAHLVQDYLVKRMEANDVNTFRNIGLGAFPSGQLSNDDKQALTEKIREYPGIVLAGFLTSSDRERNNAEEQVSRLQPDFGDDAREFSETLKKLRNQTNSIWVKVGGKFAGAMNKTRIRSLTESLPCIANAAINFATRHDFECNNFEGCEVAKKKLRTYRADFIETSEYARLGSLFAAEHCTQVNNQNDLLEEAACSALNQRNPASASTRKIKPLPGSKK